MTEVQPDRFWLWQAGRLLAPAIRCSHAEAPRSGLEARCRPLRRSGEARVRLRKRPSNRAPVEVASLAPQASGWRKVTRPASQLRTMLATAGFQVPARSNHGPLHRTCTFAISWPSGLITCVEQARQGSKEWSVRRISSGCSGSAIGVPSSAASKAPMAPAGRAASRSRS